MNTGKDEYGDETELRLQDAFPKDAKADIAVTLRNTEIPYHGSFPKDAKADIAVTVKMINVNYGKNQELLKACLPLRDYSLFVHLVRRISSQNPIMMMKRVVGLAISKLPEDSLIKPFLLKHKAEVVSMCITEYDENKTMAKIRRDGIKEGIKEGENKLSLLLQKLIAQGKNDDIHRALVDKEYREQMYEEYGLNDLNAA